MRSVVVVLPASMWAMMPMLRVFSRGTCRAMFFSSSKTRDRRTRGADTPFQSLVRFPLLSPEPQNHRFSVLSGRDRAKGKPGKLQIKNFKFQMKNEKTSSFFILKFSYEILHFASTALPPVMRKGLIGLRHLVRIFFLLDRVAAVVGGIHDLAGALVLHRLLAATVREGDQPSDGQGGAAGGPHFHGNLIVRSADATALHFQCRLDVVDCLLEQLDRIILGPIFNLLQRAVKHALGDRLLSLDHQRVDELRHQLAVVNGIRKDLAFRNFASAWHRR